MRVAISLLWLCIAFTVPAQTLGWRGIVPLRSTRADVERILGPPEQNLSRYSALYRTSTETVMIQYAQGLPCGIGEKYSQWRVPRDTVESLLVTPVQTLRISDLGIDESKYEKRQGGHLKDDVYFINEQTGESLRVFMNEVQGISYFPGTLDTDLRCPGLVSEPDIKCQGLTLPRLSSYGDVSLDRERSLLDNFSIALKDEPNRMGFIISYAGKRARLGEAKARAQRAKNYLVKERGFDSNRLTTVDGGYREAAEVELYIVPDGMCTPTPAPTIDPRDVKIVKAARSRHGRG
jgi:hypothetical protein